jgi:hypothetical protein
MIIETAILALVAALLAILVAASLLFPGDKQ